MRTTYRILIGAVVLVNALQASANPIVTLAGAAKFQAAINTAKIHGFTVGGSTKDTAGLNKAFPGQSANFQKTTVSTVTTPASGLLSKFGSAATKNKSNIGAYSYKYGADPDLTGLHIALDLYIPEVGDGITSGINTIGIGLIDTSDLVKVWTFDFTTFGVGSNTFSLNFDDGAGAGGSTGFDEDVGFDLTAVDTIQISQRAILGSTFPLTPDNGDTAAWTITSRFFVVPEPSQLIVLSLGGLAGGLFGLRRRLVSTRPHV